MQAPPALECGARGRPPPGPCPRRALDSLPHDALREVLSRLGARSLATAACASRLLGALAADDRLYAALLAARLPRLVALLEGAPAAAQPEWWAGRSWRQRTQALAGGATLQLQLYNREPENEAEDFLLSAYDATVSLPPAGAAALLLDAPPSCAGGGGQAAAAAAELTFKARYLPMGSMAAVEEAGVAASRLRLPPPGSAPFAVYADGGSASAAGLSVGEEVEVQWKGRRAHPWGYWFATVQSVRGNRLALMFRQYPRSSVWHRVRAPIKPGQEAVLNGDCSFGYVGGLRRLSAAEREEWRRHGAPCPPAPAALAALAAEDEWWSDDEEELDVDLEQAELDEQEADEAAAADQALAAAAAAAVGGGAAAAGAAAEAAPAAEEAAHAPAGPPGQPIALQLGPAAAAAAVAAAGLPVELAAASEAPPAAAAAPQGDH